ncbi:MAG: DUF2764 family protein [bacterium]|nr:DUF2764 family protein [bacterium]
MKGAYYYLISGLPRLRLDDSADLPAFAGFADFAGFLGEAMGQLTESDAKLLRILRLPIDNKNLINILEKKEMAFNPAGNYSEAELIGEVAHPENLPGYMRTIIEAHKVDMPVYYNITWEDQLNCSFYEYAGTIDNAFLRDWFSLELNMGNILSALKCREFNISFERRLDQRIENVCSQAIICHNEIAETIMDSDTRDFSLTPALPWIEDVLALDKNDLVGFEKGIDLIKWKWLDDMTCFNYFDIEALLAYGIKLQMAERWLALDAQKGRRRFDELLAGLDGAYQNYNDNVVGAVTGALV